MRWGAIRMKVDPEAVAAMLDSSFVGTTLVIGRLAQHNRHVEWTVQVGLSLAYMCLVGLRSLLRPLPQPADRPGRAIERQRSIGPAGYPRSASAAGRASLAVEVRATALAINGVGHVRWRGPCLLYTSPSPRDGLLSRMP